jgi:nucleotide-binding universal stress UspA family protein
MKILVGIDGGSQQPAALALGARLAHGGELVVATSYPWAKSATRLGASYAKTVEQDAKDILATAKEQLPGVAFEPRAIADLHAARALHNLAVDIGADLIVIGACHRGGLGRALLGGTGESVVHGSPRPVVVAPHDFTAPADPVRRIGVAYEGGAESDAALEWAERLAQDTGASLELLTVSQFVPVAMYPGVATYPTDAVMRDLHDEAESKMQEALDRVSDAVPSEGRVLDGPITTSLVEAAEGMDLLVAGSRGYGPVGSLLMGSVSRSLTHNASCPVVVVPRSAAGTEEAGAEDTGALTAAE